MKPTHRGAPTLADRALIADKENRATATAPTSFQQACPIADATYVCPGCKREVAALNRRHARDRNGERVVVCVTCFRKSEAK